MSFLDILQLAFRNLRQAKLRALLTTMGVVVGVAVIVTMVSFGLGLQQNMLARFGALDLFNEITVFGRSLTNLATAGFDRQTGRTNEGGERRGPRLKPDKNPTRILDDAAITEIAKIPGVAYVQPTISLYVYTRANGHVRFEPAAGASVPNGSSRFKTFLAGGMISSPDAPEAVVTDTFTEDFGFEKPEDAVGQTIQFLAPPADANEKSANEKSKDQTNPSDEGPANFFGIPLDEQDSNDASQTDLVARKFRIVGVLDLHLKEGPGQGGMVGLLPGAAIYVPVRAARQWSL